MALTRCFDAAYPPVSVPAGAGAVLGYIGRDHLDDDFHIWTLAEWQPFARLRQFPCWVCNTSKSPEQSAADATAAMFQLRWRQHRALIFDMEAVIDRPWVARFEAATAKIGPVPVAYESESVIGKNGATRVWAALWDGRPVLQGGWWAKQYMSGGGLDWSVVSPELLANAGVGRRL